MNIKLSEFNRNSLTASHAWWESRLGGDPSAVGKTITIDQTAYTIIGVAPEEFFGTTVGQAPDVWVPLAMEAQLPPAHWEGRNDRSFQSLYLIARLKEGVSQQQAGAAVNLLFEQWLQEGAGAQPSAERLRDIQRASIELTPVGKGLSELRREFSLSLRILMGVVGLVLLIACANVANLLLARAAARQREFAMRLVLVGVVVGLLGSLAATQAASALLYGLTPNDPLTLTLATLLLVVVSALAGYLPARAASRVDPMVALRYE